MKQQKISINMITSTLKKLHYFPEKLGRWWKYKQQSWTQTKLFFATTEKQVSQKRIRIESSMLPWCTLVRSRSAVSFIIY